jgi:hypothetical protein
MNFHRTGLRSPKAQAVLWLALAAPGAAGQTAAATDAVRPFPLEPVGAHPAGSPRLAGTPGVWEELRGGPARASFEVRLPDGSLERAVARRVDLSRLLPRVWVEGTALATPAELTETTVWTGSLADRPGSDMLLAFSPFGSRGWLVRGGDRFHLVAEPDPQRGWSGSTSHWATEGELEARFPEQGFTCRARPRVGIGDPPAPPDPPGGFQGAPLLECRVAVECDFQLFTVFGSVEAELAYLTALLVAVSERYVDQLDVVLTYPFLRVWSTADDPWTAQDGGGDAEDVLDELRGAWAGSIPASAHLAHLVSGADLEGGHAFVDALCDPQWAFAVSGNIEGDVPFPVGQGPLTWDFVVFAHETGHVFGAQHTHEYCPPIDECASLVDWGPCQDEETCRDDGTLMSYCHTCEPGMENITTFFHPQIAGILRQRADASCLQQVCAGLPEVWVDAGAPGPGDGSAQDPFRVLAQGIAVATSCGVDLRALAGSYDETIRIEDPLVLRAEGGTVVIDP